jgi:hypothetical protein
MAARYGSEGASRYEVVKLIADAVMEETATIADTMRVDTAIGTPHTARRRPR